MCSRNRLKRKKPGLEAVAIGLLAVSTSVLWARDFSFDRTDWTNVGGGVGSVQAGDMDNDGDMDIVGIGGRNIFIFRNDGAGGWTRFGDLDSTGESGLNGSELYDVDKDGDLDVVAAKYRKDLGWWENPGGRLTNTKWTFHRLATGVDGWFLHDIIRGDLDKDGKAEEFVCVLQSGYWNAPFHIHWYRPAADTLQDWEQHVITNNQAGPNNNHAGIDLADIDGDADVDLVFSNGWFESPGDPAGAWTWHKVTDIYGVSNALARDMDGDKDMDLVVSAGHHGQGVFWFENTGTPPLAGPWVQHNISQVRGDIFARHRYAPPEDGSDHIHHPEGLQVHDLDFDGDLDVMASELFFGEDAGEPGWDEQASNLYIYENLGGNPPLWNKQNVSPNSWPNHIPYLFDINDDGRMDIITEGPRINNISYLENVTGTPPIRFRFDLEVVDGNTQARGWSSSGDLNGDGRIDIVAGGGRVLNWYEAPSWTLHSIDDNSEAGGNGGLVFDVDGDGRLDVVAAQYLDDLVWWKNPGPAGVTGNWTRFTIDASNFGYNHDLVLADIDGDVVDDVIALMEDGAGKESGVFWYKIPPDPTQPWPRVRILNSIGNPYVGLAAGDLDGDNDVDVVISNQWYENANPNAPDWTVRMLFPEPVQNLYVYDVNQDGRKDVIGSQGFHYPGYTGGPGGIMWAEAPVDPKNQTWPVHMVATNLDGPENLWVGDLNEDGFTDIVSGEMGTSTGWNDNDSNFTVYAGLDTTGDLWETHTVKENVGVFARIMPVDIDGDGDLDFTADGNAEPHVYLWRNRAKDPPVQDTTPPSLVSVQVRAKSVTILFNEALDKPSAENRNNYFIVRGVSVIQANLSSDTKKVALATSPHTPGRLYTLTVQNVRDEAMNAMGVSKIDYEFSEGLVAWWRFDDGSGGQAVDSSGKAHTGTVSGAQWTTGKFAGALSFDGSDDYVYRSDDGLNAAFPCGSSDAAGDFTIAAWIRRASSNERHPIVSKQGTSTSGNARGCVFEVSSDNQLSLEVFKNDTDRTGVISSAAIAVGRWYHVAVTYEYVADGSSKVRLYIDGVNDGGTDAAVGPPQANPQPVEIGRYWWNASYTRHWDGLIDEVRVYSRALDESEIRELMVQPTRSGHWPRLR